MANTIVNWEYYHSLFTSATEDEFNKFVALAEKQVRAVVGEVRWSSMDHNSYKYDRLRDCICMVIDRMVSNEKSGVGEGLASVSNDGYSENYVVQTQSQAYDEMRSYIVRWLSGTGLVGAYKC